MNSACVCARVGMRTRVSVQALCACARVYLYEPPRSGGGSANNTGEVGTVTHLRRPDVHTAWKFRTPSPLRGLHFPRGLAFLLETMLPLMSRSDPHVRGGQGPRLGTHFLGPLQHPGCCCPLNRRPTEQPDGWGLASMGDPCA